MLGRAPEAHADEALRYRGVAQATLDGYAKSRTVEDITNTIAALHRHGIKCHRVLMFTVLNDPEGDADGMPR